MFGNKPGQFSLPPSTKKGKGQFSLPVASKGATKAKAKAFEKAEGSSDGESLKEDKAEGIA